jgi:hypothetical protein
VGQRLTPPNANKRSHVEKVYAAEPATLAFLRWSELSITFDRSNHPERIPHPFQYPLIVDPIISPKRLSKVLMDGGSGLNIMYVEMLDAMGVSRAQVRPTRAPFHGIILGKQAKSLGQIDLPITFGTPTNFRKETITFEVVGFHRTYHAILGHPCYAKLMAIPKYTYLKLKMSGPCGVITVGSSYKRAYKCEVECCELTAVTIASEELATIRVVTVKEMPDSKLLACSFEPTENTKEVPVDPSIPDGKVLRVSTDLSPK